MLKCIILPADGVIDGFNTVFSTPVDYVAGSLRVFVNGFVQMKGFDDGWIELASPKFMLKIAPIVGDTVTAYFKPM